uniref:Integrin alpha-3-like n=1 Tax=Salarias fasciatus TaxID=181472 RepID=A0A672HKA5_SALFA
SAGDLQRKQSILPELPCPPLFPVTSHVLLFCVGRLLVGAPREKAEPKVPAERTGGVYSCPITADQSDCRRMALIDPDLNTSEDLVEDMWLGVSVASQGRPGGRVLACGHRFVKLYGTSKLRHMIGQCYLRGNDLQYNVSDQNWQNPEQTCSHLGDASEEAMCSMGISAFITQTEVIVGSPGSYEWQGIIFVFSGYSVTQARRLLSEEEETIVTGAPKDSKEDARGSVLLALKRSGQLAIQQTLRGEQMGSYFGNAVATADLNSDGWSDLLVGAPFYFQRQQEAGGAVYVYMNTRGSIESEPSVVLRGPAGSAFGMSVAAAGDVNQDGFQDFAVGAPFHESGTVMIWTGSSQGVSTEPSQVVQGSRVSPGFRTFGYSLSAGLDVDGNRYPDLLVGSLDDTVALLRSRPVIHLNKTLRVSPDVVDMNLCDFCIQVEACFSYTFSSGETSRRDNITVHFTITADVTSLKPRLRFPDGSRVFSGYLSMPKRACHTLSVGLQPLVFSLNVSLHQKLPKKRNSVQDLRHFPVLSQPPRPIRTQIQIQKACGDDNHCHSNLQMKAQFTDENQKPFMDQLLFYNDSVKRLFLEVNVSNTPSPGRLAEDAHNAVLTVSIPPSLVYSAVQTQEGSSVDCSVQDQVVQCELGNPFKSNQKVQVFIKFQTSEISLDTRDVQSRLQLSTLSEQTDLSPLLVSMLVDYSLQTSLALIHPPGPAFFSGHVIGESAMRKTEDVGSLLLFTLQVHLYGKPLGHLGNLAVEFDWPKETSNGKWLLYLTEIRVDGVSEPQCAPPGVINPLRLTLKTGQKTNRQQKKEQYRGDDGGAGDCDGGVVLQDCLHGASCVTFACPLIDMNNSATLNVRLRLWNSTMMEDYIDARGVTVRGRVTLKLNTSKPTVEFHIYPEAGLQADSGAPLWIMVVSVLAGLLLLALICLLLWKCGFFRRARTRELYEAKTQKAHMKSQPSESQRLTEEL